MTTRSDRLNLQNVDLQQIDLAELARRSKGYGLRCPLCRNLMVLRRTDKFRYGSGRSRLFWGCIRFPDCNSTHGAHPNGKPLGIPADAETKQSRMKAHEAFDKLWTEHGLSRRESYTVLQKMMGMSADEAHIGRFDIAQCQRLISLCRTHGAALTLLSHGLHD